MPHPDPLAKAFVADALELHRRQLWTRGAQEGPVLLRVPSVELPVVATLIGRAGQDFGLNLDRGEQAFAEAVRLQYSGDESPYRKRSDLVSFTLDRLGRIPPEFRAPLEAAGFRGRRELLAPWVIVVPADGGPRGPRKSELRLLAWCLRGLLLADDQGQLEPLELDIRDRRVLAIEVSGKRPSAARARVGIEPWPQEVPGLEAGPEPVDDPDTLEEWKQAERAFIDRFMQEIMERGLWNVRTLAAYFGGEDLSEQVLDRLGGLLPEAAFAEWLIADHRATPRSRTWLEDFLERGDATPAERALAEARADAALSVYRVDEREPGEWLEVEDLLEGGRVRLWDGGLSQSLPEGAFLALRLLRLGRWVTPCLAGPPLAGHQVDRVLERLEAEGADLGDLRATPRLLGRFWRARLEAPALPALTNTDGDPLRLQSASFTVEQPDLLVPALEARDDVDQEDGGWIWFREGGVLGDADGRTILGHLELLDDRLLLEVNSHDRLARARRWIEALPGAARFEHATEKGVVRPLDDRLPGPPAAPLPPEAREQLAAFLLERQLAWLDESIPALGGKTPREACRSAAGRRRVAAMVRSMPAVGVPGGKIEPPRARLLAELGLEQ